ncbi:MAG: DUF2071 domain-containing protein [Planctomycetes bacterium]|nr:DUF2071 domain-containing protein [Planctomycetota bacterium]
MVNFEVDPALLLPLTPSGTELDDWNGVTLMSLVGFRFLNTQVCGCRVPWHRDFEELNLRFYVRRRAPEGWRRGVVFIKEIVPKRAVTLVARKVYGENYVTLPMGHEIREEVVDGTAVCNVAYHWRLAQRLNYLGVETTAEPTLPSEGSQHQFIAEHYWGYTRLGDGRGLEYRVDHPPWRVSPAKNVEMQCDAALLYGEPLAEFLTVPPVSAFLAEGSAVTVYRGTAVHGE